MNYKPLHIPKRDRKKGEYILCVYTDCKTTVGKICKSSGKALHTCKHAESHRFQSKAWDPNKKRMVPIETHGKDFRDYKKFSLRHVQAVAKFEIDQQVPTQSINIKPSRLRDALRMYNDWFQDKDEKGNLLPHHKIKGHSENTIKDEFINIKVFKQALLELQYDFDTILLDQVDVDMVGKIFKWLTDKYANRTVNNKLNTISRFYKYLIEIKDYNISNPFSNREVIRKTVQDKDGVFIEPDHFKKLLGVVTLENGIAFTKEKSGVKRRSLFRSWLTFYYRLEFCTGGRPEDIAELKVDHVLDDFIRFKDFKVSRKKKTERIRMRIRTKEFDDLFDELVKHYGLKPGMYLIEPEEANRKKIIRHASKAWTHYWKQLDVGYHATFYDLRGTYATIMSEQFGTAYEGIFGMHDSHRTTRRNYNSKQKMLSKLRGKPMFEAKSSAS
ncbi:hypothetical protein [Ekhidna sp.]